MSSEEVPTELFEDDTWKAIMSRRRETSPDRETFLKHQELEGQQWAIDALKEINKDQEPEDVLERANLKRKITAHETKENNMRSAGKIKLADKHAKLIKKLKDELELKNMETESHTGGGRRKKKKSKRKKHSKKKKHSKRRKSSKRKSKRRKSKKRSKRR